MNFTYEFYAAAIYFLVMSVVLFVMMGIDKKKAQRRKHRIKENVLFFVAFIGGALGGFMGMYIFSHKTRKPLFSVVFIGSFVIHAVILYLLS